MRIFIPVLLLFSIAPATAQQQSSSAIDRIAGSLAQCVVAAEQKVDQIVDLQKQLGDTRARIKELETKQEPKQ